MRCVNTHSCGTLHITFLIRRIGWGLGIELLNGVAWRPGCATKSPINLERALLPAFRSRRPFVIGGQYTSNVRLGHDGSEGRNKKKSGLGTLDIEVVTFEALSFWLTCAWMSRPEVGIISRNKVQGRLAEGFDAAFTQEVDAAVTQEVHEDRKRILGKTRLAGTQSNCDTRRKP